MGKSTFGHDVRPHSQFQGITEVVLSRQDVHNAFNDEMIGSLTDTFNRLGQEAGVRALVLRAEGASFCAGADLNWMKKMKAYGHEQNLKDSKALSGLFRALDALPMPVVGLVQGAAYGGGVGLVACCDYVLAAQEAMFALTEVRLGLVPAVISPFVMSKIGESAARAYFLTGARFDAGRAQQLGLVHECAPAAKLEEAYQKLLNVLLETGPVAAREAKDLVRAVKRLAAQEETELMHAHVCGTIARVRIGSEAQEGMGALLEKRTPSWAPPKKK